MSERKESKIIRPDEWRPLEEAISTHRSLLKERLNLFVASSEDVVREVERLSSRVDKLEQILYALLEKQGDFAKHSDADHHIKGRTKLIIAPATHRRPNKED